MVAKGPIDLQVTNTLANDVKWYKPSKESWEAFYRDELEGGKVKPESYEALIITNRLINPEWIRATEAYKSFIKQSFSGSGLVLTILLVLLYESLLIGSAILILTGNPLAPTARGRLFAAAGLAFIVFILSLFVLAVPLRELIRLAPYFVFLSLIWIPAVAGLGMYVFVIDRFQRRTLSIEGLHNLLDTNLVSIFSDTPPRNIQRLHSSNSTKLNLIESKLDSGLPKSFDLDYHLKEGELNVQEVESAAVQEIKNKITETNLVIGDDIKSAFNSDHLENDQINQVFHHFLRTEELEVFNKHLPNMK